MNKQYTYVIHLHAGKTYVDARNEIKKEISLFVDNSCGGRVGREWADNVPTLFMEQATHFVEFVEFPATCKNVSALVTPLYDGLH
jgi:hypothetical protein